MPLNFFMEKRETLQSGSNDVAEIDNDDQRQCRVALVTQPLFLILGFLKLAKVWIDPSFF